MFRSVSLSIIRTLALYTQQQVYVVQVLLTACQRDPDPASKQSVGCHAGNLDNYAVQVRYIQCSAVVPVITVSPGTVHFCGKHFLRKTVLLGGVATGLPPPKPRNHGSISDRTKHFVTSKVLRSTMGGPNRLQSNGCLGAHSPMVKSSWLEAHFIFLISLFGVHRVNFDFAHCVKTGQLSQLSDLLRVGRSGNRIPVEGEFFRARPDRLYGRTSLLYNVYPSRSVALNTHPLQRQG